MPRRRGLLLKALLAVPATWLLVTLLLTYNDHPQGPVVLRPGQQPQQQQKEANFADGGAGEAKGPQENEVMAAPAVKHKREEADVPPLARKRNRGNLNPIKPEEASKDRDKGAALGVLIPPRNPDDPGEMGRPVVLNSLSAEQEKKVKKGWDLNAFNQYISDMISLHRSLPDVRDSE